MFQKRKAQPFLRFESASSKQLFKRAATLCAGIFCLWIALQVMPKPGSDLLPPDTTTEAAPVISKDSSENRSNTMGFLKNTQIIAGILLIGLFGFMYYRRNKFKQEHASIKSLKTLNRIQLNPNQSLYLIECGEDVLLIGATNTQITLLKNIPLTSLTQHTVDESARSVSFPFTTPVSTHPEPGDFASLLNSYSSANTN